MRTNALAREPASLAVRIDLGSRAMAKRSAAEIAKAMMGGGAVAAKPSKPSVVTKAASTAPKPAPKTAATKSREKEAAKPAARSKPAAAKPAAGKSQPVTAAAAASAKFATPAAKPTATSKPKTTSKPTAAAKSSAGSSPAGARAKPAAISLAECARLAEAGDWPDVLDGLLVAWRVAPSTPLGDLIVAIGEVVKQPLAGTWEAVAKQYDSCSLSSLLETVLDKGSIQARGRVETLVEWPMDPRIDRWAADRYVEVTYTSTGARPFWTRMVPLASRVVDPAASLTFTKARKKVAKDHFLAPYLERIRAAIGEVPEVPMTDETQRVVTAVRASLDASAAKAKPARAGDVEALLAAVLAKPDDEGPRIVLADVLMEAEHPRGELIALQTEATRRELTAAEQKRERELIKANRKELLGPLDAILKPESTFAKGFLARAFLKQGNAGLLLAAIKKSAGHPLWATVEHLEGDGDYDVTRHAVLRSLRSLANSDVGVEWLAKHPRLEALSGERADEKWLAVANRADSFPALRDLDVRCGIGNAQTLLASPLAKRLARLQLRFSLASGFVPVGGEPALGMFPIVAKSGLPDVTLRLVKYEDKDWSAGFRFVRENDALTVRVFITAMRPNWEDHIMADVMNALARVEDLAPARLILERGFRVKAAQQRLETRIQELGGVVEPSSRT
jgi:uncharacterized protein (TIGR02996 family)